MVNEVRRIGGPPGREAVEKDFRVPPADIGREGAARLVREALKQPGAPTCERLHVSQGHVSRGALVDMSGAVVRFPDGEVYDRSYVALVDPDARALWAHPAAWAFVPAAGNDAVLFVSTNFPEHALSTVRFHMVNLR
jgi:hypothetical protein